MQRTPSHRCHPKVVWQAGQVEQEQWAVQFGQQVGLGQLAEQQVGQLAEQLAELVQKLGRVQQQLVVGLAGQLQSLEQL